MISPILRKVTCIQPLEYEDVPSSEVPEHYVAATFAGRGLCWVDPELFGIEDGQSGEAATNSGRRVERI